MKINTKYDLPDYQLTVTNIEVREMEVSHLPAVVDIERDNFRIPWSYRSFYEDVRNESAIALVALLGVQNVADSAIGDTECGVNHIGIHTSPEPYMVQGGVRNSVVGYAVAWIVSNEIHIGNIAVHEEYRKKGIGESLLKEVLMRGEERGVKMATLEVRISNEPAIHLYRKFGFQEVAIRKEYYRDNGEDGLVMIKTVVRS